MDLEGVLDTVYRRAPDTGVWVRPDREAFVYTDGEEAERYLLDSLLKARDLSSGSEELVDAIRDWPSEYHFSPNRANLLRSLRLGRDQRVLEIGAGCGALTRLLGETGAQVLAVEGSERRAEITAARCRDLANVRVCSDGFQRFDLDLDFDVATLIGVLEYAPSFFEGEDPVQQCLAHASRYLREGGALILAIENRLGLKYFNGAGEDHTNHPFDSINDLYAPGTCRTFSKTELELELRRAGFQDLEFVFPFPDYKLPKLLVHERALADPELETGVLAAQHPGRDYVLKPARLFSEARLWPALAREGMLPALANSFLVVAVKGTGAAAEYLHGDWLAQSFATDRRRCYRAMNTFARSDRGIVVRKAMLGGGAIPAGPLVHKGGAEEGYRGGEPYNARLERIVFSKAGYDEYLAYLGRYARYLERHGVLRAADALGFERFLPGSWYDRIPCNLMDAGEDDLVPIDQEWEHSDELPLQYLVFRAIVHDLSRVDCFGNMSLFGGAATLGEFIQRVFADLRLALDDEQLAALVEREQAALCQVLPARRVPDFASALDTPPERLFGQVHDMLSWRVPGLEGAESAEDASARRVHALQAELAAQRHRADALRASLSYRLGRLLVGTVRWPLTAMRRAKPRS